MQNAFIWQSEILYHSGDAYYDALNAAIAEARSQILLETYIFELDVVGRRVLTSLAQAAARGVRVRLMVDGIGSMAWTQATLDGLKKRGIRTRIYHPVMPHAFAINSRFFRRWTKALMKVNRRNHRKVCVIDGKVAFLGGMNISRKHSERLSGPQAWRDTSVCVTGPECGRLVVAFELAWRGHRFWKRFGHREPKGRKKESEKGSLILNYSRKLRARAVRLYCQRIAEAKTRVWITNPYFVPRLRLMRVLRKAARRGVDVRMVFPRKNDVALVRTLSATFYGALLSSGVRVFEYLPRVLHAKTTIVDDWCAVGSSNLNHRSLMHDLEVDVALRAPESLRQLEAAFQQDLHLSEEVKHSRWLKRSLWNRLWERLLSWLRYWS